MPGIQTGIELNDQFSGVLNHIVSSVNLAVSAMYDMQESMNADIDTSSLEGARAEINQATMAVNELEQALSGLYTPAISALQVDPGAAPVINHNAPPSFTPQVENPQNIPPAVRPNAPPEPVTVPVVWQTDGLDVFTSSGVERFQQEVQSANSMLNTLNQTQVQIEQTASGMDILPDTAVQDINALGQRLQAIQQRIQQVENNPVNLGTDTANAGLEQLRSQLNMAVQEQTELNRAMQDMDASAANDAYLRLSQTVSGTERYIRDNVDEQGRFNREIQEGTYQAGSLMNAIKGAVLAYVSIHSIGKALNISDELVQTTARLNIMNDGMQTTQELVNMVYAAAQDARGSFADMADVVARFGNNAGNAFSSSEEVVAFANLIQKQMTIAGASTQEAANATLQLSQGLAAGALRGEELNSILEQAPTIARTIESAMGWAEGSIKSYAEQGLVTAQVVKNAMLSSADEIDAKFEQMPMTWGQIWQSMQNTALIAFQPVLQRLNDIANSEAFQTFANGAIEAMAVLAHILLNIFDLAVTAGSFIADNWSIIGPIVYGVAAAFGVYTAALVVNTAIQGINTMQKRLAAIQAVAHGAAITAEMVATTGLTAAQLSFNAALYACPIVWIILLIVALIAIIFAVCNAIAKMTGIANSGFGVIVGGVAIVVAVVRNLVIGLINTLITWIVNFYNMTANFAAAFGVLFNNPVAAIKAVMLSLFNYIVGVVGKAAAMLDAVFGSNLAGVVSQFQGKIQAEVDATIESAGGTAANILNPADYMIDRVDYGEAFKAGASWGDGITDKVRNFSLSDLFGKEDIPDPSEYTSGFDDVIANSGIGDGVDDIAGNTGAIKDSMDITEEDLKYLRDIAEQEAVNRYTVAEIHVDMSGMQNNVNSGDDIDGFITKLTDSVNEAVDSMAEGEHK